MTLLEGKERARGSAGQLPCAPQPGPETRQRTKTAAKHGQGKSNEGRKTEVEKERTVGAWQGRAELVGARTMWQLARGRASSAGRGQG